MELTITSEGLDLSHFISDSGLTHSVPSFAVILWGKRLFGETVRGDIGFVCVCQISFKYLHGAFYIYIIKYIYISLKYHFLFTSFYVFS